VLDIVDELEWNGQALQLALFDLSEYDTRKRDMAKGPGGKIVHMKEACSILDMSRKTVVKHAIAGDVPGWKNVLGEWCFYEQALINVNAPPPTPPPNNIESLEKVRKQAS